MKVELIKDIWKENEVKEALKELCKLSCGLDFIEEGSKKQEAINIARSILKLLYEIE